jgi:hypothetical protein
MIGNVPRHREQSQVGFPQNRQEPVRLPPNRQKRAPRVAEARTFATKPAETHASHC